MIYKSHMVAWMRKHVPGKPVRESLMLFNAKFDCDLSYETYRAALKNRNIKTGVINNPPPTKRLLTAEQHTWVEREYKSKAIAELLPAFNGRFPENRLSQQQLYSYCKRYKIKSGRTGRYKPGNVPWIKGTKGATGANPGSFKKGQIPHNTKQLGHERLHKQGYVLISIDETNPHTGFRRRYVLKHRHIWQQAHGEIPADQVLKFIDGDRSNCDLGNLQLIPRSLLPTLAWDGYDHAPEELKPVIMANAKLKNRITQVQRQVADSTD